MSDTVPPSGHEKAEGKVDKKRYDRRGLLRRGAITATAAGTLPALLAACGGSGAGDAASTASAEVGGGKQGGNTAYDVNAGVDPKSVGKKTLGVIPIVGTAQPAKRWIAGVQEQADAAGWTVQITDANGDLNKAAAAWANYVQAGVDGLVAAGFDPKQWGPQIKEASGAEIPYVSLFSSWGDGVTANIAADLFVEGGALATVMIDRTGGKGGVVIFDSTPIPALHVRTQAVEAHLADNSEMKILENHEIDLSKIQQDCFSTMQALLQKYPEGEISAVFGGYIGAALPAAQACVAAGRNEIICVGSDGDLEGLAAIRKGTDPFVATTGCNFEAVGANAVRQLAQVFSGEDPLGKQIYQEAPVIVKQNVPASGYAITSPTMTTYSLYGS